MFRALHVENWWRWLISRWLGWSADEWLSVSKEKFWWYKVYYLFTIYYHLNNLRFISSADIQPSFPFALYSLEKLTHLQLCYHNASVKPIRQSSLWHSSNTMSNTELKNIVKCMYMCIFNCLQCITWNKYKRYFVYKTHAAMLNLHITTWL